MSSTPVSQLVGIVNLTPDSFSDGGMHLHPEDAFLHLESLVEAGADVLDIGAESTRPGAMLIGPEPEWERLEPVIAHARAHVPQAAVSVDTRHAETARRAIALGAEWINDVSGFSDPEMVEAVRDSSAKLVVMHSLSVPADPAVVMEAEDVVDAVVAWLARRAHELEEQGIRRDRLIVDPGIGFGKTAEQSLALIRGVHRLQSLELPVLIGHSRKSFLTLFTQAEPRERDGETLAISAALMLRGVSYLRVHDMARHGHMRRILERIA